MKRILNGETIVSHGNRKIREDILNITEAGLEAADPYYNTKKLISVEDGVLKIGGKLFEPNGSPEKGEACFLLGKDIERIFVFAVGKGIQRSVVAVEEILGSSISGGLVIAKQGDKKETAILPVEFGAHPVPDESCVKACEKLLQSIKDAKLSKKDLVIFISGNGISSLLTLPPKEIPISDAARVTEILQIKYGMVTTKLNMIRNQIDLLKGGRITRCLQPAKVIHIVAIDPNAPNSFGDKGYKGLVVTNTWLHSLPDISSPQKALDVINESGTESELPDSVLHYIKNEAPQNPTLTVEEFEKFNGRVFGLMPEELAVYPSAKAKAKELGYVPHLLSRKTFAEASALGAFCGRIARTIEDENEPFQAGCALFVTGELLVTVSGESGVGGRNQEFALSAAHVIRGSTRIAIAAVDTDGTDGPGGVFNEEAKKLGCCGLSGGIVDGTTSEAAMEHGISVSNALKTHGTSDVLWRLGDAVWATQNVSVCDLIVILVAK